MTTEKYTSHKNSGVSWLGEIPEHWEVRRIKYVFNELQGRSTTGNEDLLSVSQYTGVTKKSDKTVDGESISNAKTLVGYKTVSKGDLVINIMLAWNGSLGISPYDGITSPAYSVYRLIGGNEKYFGYLFTTPNAKQEFKKQSTGIIDSRLRMYTDSFFNIKTALPPVSEQTAIANFLDYKLEKTYRFIAKKKQLIELLSEQKAAIINKAVTKGINPNAKLKPSGIEWLGDIPEHWKVVKLRYLAKIKTGRTPKIESSSIDYFKNGSINWYTPGDFGNGGFLSTAKRTVHNEAIQNNQIEIFPSNTVYLIGIGGTIGKVGFCENEGSSNQQINAIIFNDQIISKFGFYSLKCAKHQIDLLADFTTLPILNQSKTKEILIPHTRNQDEQIEIIHHIERETSKIDKTISTIEKEITLVEEYKTALIAEVVTGKMDVRDFKIPTTEEPIEMVAKEASNFNKVD